MILVSTVLQENLENLNPRASNVRDVKYLVITLIQNLNRSRNLDVKQGCYEYILNRSVGLLVGPNSIHDSHFFLQI